MESIRHARKNPIPLTAIPLSARTTSTAPQATSPGGNPAAGERSRKRTPCRRATTVPPRTFPRAVAQRGPGAAITPRRNPRCRSSITDIVLEMPTKRTIITTTPG